MPSVFSADQPFASNDSVLAAPAASTRSPTWSQDRGIYAAPAKGGPATLVTRDGDAPHFGAGSERVFFAVASEEKGEDKVELASIELDGSDLRTHVKTENGTRLRVSPDGRWIAWTEGFQALVAPFREAARAQERGAAGGEGQPRRRRLRALVG